MKESILIEKNGYINYLIETVTDDYSMKFTVYEVSSWGMDNTVRDKDKYISGNIKWDGCSHLHFGNDDGYIHMCGKHYFQNHILVINALWDMAEKTIKKFDREVAE